MGPPMRPDQVAPTIGKWGRFDKPAHTVPKLLAGDTVVAKRHGKTGHTRLPGYVRGRTGRVERFYGFYIHPDTNMRNDGPAEALYLVSFAATDLWPDAENPRDRVHIDLWESYLDRA
jgi:nitrile hydratase